MDSMHLLRQLASQRLPARVISDDDVETVRILVLAGHAKALVPERTPTLGGHRQPPAIVTEVTRLGHIVLSMFPERRAA